MTYQIAIVNGLSETRKWMSENNITELPEDPWKLPAGCPIWKMGLSAAQAGGIVAALRREMAGGPVAQT